MASSYDVSIPTQMVTSSFSWGGPPNASYPSIPLERHPHGVFTEQADPEVQQPYVEPGSFEYGHAYGTMPTGQDHPSYQPPSNTNLPQPVHILLSQGSPKACLACGKTSCTLVSHRHFSKHVMTAPKRRQIQHGRTQLQEQVPSQPITSPTISRHPEGVVQFPIVMDAERQQLFSLWSRQWSRSNRGPERHLFPVKFVDRVLPAAQIHAPLFQSLLALSATLWAQANNIVDEVAGRQHTFAIQMLSQACPTEQSASTDESMLAAVLILLVYLAQGNGFEVGKHISGLVHLATLRGGIHYLGMSGLVAEMLMYADHMQAIFFDRDPVWKLPMPPLDVGLPPRFGHGFQTLINTNEIDQPLLIAANSLCRVADIFQFASSNGVPLPTDAKNAFGYLSSITEFQLAQCNARYHSSPSSRDECLCLTLILFNLVILRNDGAITPAIRKIEYRLWASVEAADAVNGLQKLPPRLLLWMLMMGLTVAIRGECQWRTSAVEKMRAIRVPASISGWDQFKTHVLDVYVWFEAAQEEVFKRIWLEVESARTMPAAAKG